MPARDESQCFDEDLLVEMVDRNEARSRFRAAAEALNEIGQKNGDELEILYRGMQAFDLLAGVLERDGHRSGALQASDAGMAFIAALVDKKRVSPQCQPYVDRFLEHRKKLGGKP